MVKFFPNYISYIRDLINIGISVVCQVLGIQILMAWKQRFQAMPDKCIYVTECDCFILARARIECFVSCVDEENGCSYCDIERARLICPSSTLTTISPWTAELSCRANVFLRGEFLTLTNSIYLRTQISVLTNAEETRFTWRNSWHLWRLTRLGPKWLSAHTKLMNLPLFLSPWEDQDAWHSDSRASSINPPSHCPLENIFSSIKHQDCGFLWLCLTSHFQQFQEGQ